MTPYSLHISIATACLLISSTVFAAPGNGKPHDKPLMLGKGQAFTTWDLPPGRVRQRLESLPMQARQRGLEWLRRFEFPAADLESIHVDDDGAVLYAEPVPDLPLFPADPEQGSGADDGFPTAAAAAADDAFLLHSRPNAPHVLYLDFDGHEISGTAWNDSHDPLYAKPFDLDGDPSSFNDAERATIAEIWHRVAEDYAPFDIDVTTEEPYGFDEHTGRVLITSKTDADGRAMPFNSGGGVAYVGVWGYSLYPTKYSPALVYYDNLAGSPTYIAEASSHEFGHNLGLSHDGTGSTTYYPGHGSGFTSWAPIMGNSHYNNVTQWSKGEYAGANNTQDDIAVVADNLSLAGDDHGDSRFVATPLSINASGEVLASDPESDPHKLFPENRGVIDSASDWDYFRFDADGSVNLTVRPSWQAFYRTSRRGGNLDVRAVLFDDDGNILAESDPASDTFASISATLAPGSYYLGIQGVGSSNYSPYASQGQYFISGTVASEPNIPPVADFSFACAELSCSFVDGSTDTDGSITSRAWDFGDGSSSTAQNPSRSYATSGSYTVTLTVTDDDGASDSTSQVVTVSAVLPNAAPVANFGYNCTLLGCSFGDASSDGDGSVVSWSWDFGDGTTSTAQSPSHSYATSGSYTVSLTVTDDDGATDTASQTVTVTGGGGSGGSTLLQEDFSAGMPAGWTAVDEGTKYGPSAWSVSSGTLLQFSNIYGGSTSGSLLPKPGSYLSYGAGSTWTDYRASFTLRSDDDDAVGLMFRVANSNNYYRFSWDRQRSYRRLVKNVNGTFTLLAEDNVPYTKGQTYQVEVEASGDSLELRINGAVVFSVNDSSHAAGTIAFYSWGNKGARFDGLLVEAIGPSSSNESPQADFSDNCTDLVCSFGDASSDGDGSVVSWSWDFGDGTTSTAQSPSHSYATSGSYMVSLTVTDDDGATDTASQTVTVTGGGGTGVGLIVDNKDANTETTGAWRKSSGDDPWAGQSVYSNSGSVFRWLPAISESGRYQVFAWWTYHQNRSTGVPYRVGYADGVSTVTVNQRDPALGGKWVLLGEYDFAVGAGFVEVSSENGQASADAVRLVKNSGS